MSNALASESPTGKSSSQDDPLTVMLCGVELSSANSAADAAARVIDLGKAESPAARVFTCNVDHIMLMRKYEAFRAAYERASMVTVDGAPIVALAKAVGTPLAGRVTGADLVPALAHECARRGLSMALIGGATGVAEEAARRLKVDNPHLRIAATASPAMGFQDGDSEDRALVAQLIRDAPDVLVICFGSPRQEMWIDAHAELLPGTVMVGAGAALDFIACVQRRAPAYFRRSGFEWLYRLVTDFPRLWRRYLVRDSRFVFVAAREIFARRRKIDPPEPWPADRDIGWPEAATEEATLVTTPAVDVFEHSANPVAPAQRSAARELG
jgi:N-acetylglucosaminyldiphosphoundecaprenol N-acetyl-beta-D-mannosaminyltransferase